eukprot:CAMPEP_0182908670 /NCGR_PEP_ID=MMETSP0034_2-20130328/35334_1 /TAXON_ID=156128 /ORGANISM="Nephroselmis pyriformis, Strain CCMP717" /LENGTH=210 /DNA_ID=CAMNT_0025044861 /DNA_START=13 /DNA_END=645 /DNA_ORIENTATION=-
MASTSASISARAPVRRACIAAKSSYSGARVPAALRLKPVRASRGNAQKVYAVAVGDKIPDVELSSFDSEGNMQTMSTRDLCAGKKIVLFAVPGAFTPTCSLKHLPSFIDRADDLRAKGIDDICCVAVNDAFVMDAWGKSVGADDKIMMLADGSAKLAKALEVSLDLTDKGLGVRSRRYAMLLDDGVVKTLNLEEGGAFTVSSAEDILAKL